MKRRLILLLALVASYIGAAAADFEVNGIWYNRLSDDAAEVTSGPYRGNVVIPRYVTYGNGNYMVTAIGENAFRDSDVESVTIPETVTDIGEGAFSNCNSLTSIMSGIAVVHNNAQIVDGKMIRYHHNSSAFSYTIPQTVNKIDDGAFSGESQLKFVTIPNTVLSIGNAAFKNCENLTAVDIPNSVTSIGNEAFSNCVNLKSVDIPNSVTWIGDEAFSNCKNLNSVNIPNSVDSIGYEAFRLCVNLVSVEIPNPKATIGFSAFRGCINLKSVSLPDSLTYIGPSVFHDCYSLEDITIPNTVTSIGSEAFRFCWSLTRLTVPGSVKEIGQAAFAGCHKLESLIMAGNMEKLEDELLRDCRSLKEFYIPVSVTEIGNNVFYGCDALVAIHAKYPLISTNYTIYNNVLVKVLPTAKLTSFTVPNNVTSIAEGAFRNCEDLISVDIPDNVTEIGGSAFEGCCNLKSITLPKDITEINGSTFEGCSNLKSVTLPENLMAIKHRAFAGCGFTSINLPNNLESIDIEAFLECKELESITLPQSLVELGDWAFNGCTSLREVKGKYATSDHHCLIDNEGALVLLATSDLTEYTIPNRVKRIAHHAASMTDNSMLRTLHIPNTVEIIDGEAFKNLYLTTLELPNSVKRINDGAFSRMCLLRSIVLPASLQVMQGNIFNECINLQSITIGVSDPAAIHYEGHIFAGFENYKHCTLYVPAGSKGLYSVDSRWNRFSNIVEMEPTTPYHLAAEDISLTPGELTMLPVSMVNDSPIISIKFEVEMPEGVFLSRNDDLDHYLVGSDRMNDHTYTDWWTERISQFEVISPTNTEFYGYDGVLFSLPVYAASGRERTEAIVIRNIILTDSYFNEIEVPQISVAAKVQESLPHEDWAPGDANGDGRYTISDVTAVLRHVLRGTYVGPNGHVADVNVDGEITMADVVTVISHVLDH